MDADVGQRKGLSPLPPLIGRVNGEGERRGLGRVLVPGRHRGHAVGAGPQERRVVIVVGDAQVILDNCARPERTSRDLPGVVLVVAGRAGEQQGHRLPGGISGPPELQRAAVLQLVTGIPALTGELVAGNNGDLRDR